VRRCVADAVCLPQVSGFKLSSLEHLCTLRAYDGITTLTQLMIQQVRQHFFTSRTLSRSLRHSWALNSKLHYSVTCHQVLPHRSSTSLISSSLQRRGKHVLKRLSCMHRPLTVIPCCVLTYCDAFQRFCDSCDNAVGARIASALAEVRA
jgi:hypothetical protein